MAICRVSVVRYLLGVLLLLGLAVSGSTAPPHTRTYTEPQLKYLLLDHYGEDRFFFCDPDSYPIPRGDDQEKAVEAFPATRNSTDEFDAIVQRAELAPPFSGEAQLGISREHKRLQAIPLTPATAVSKAAG